MMLAKIQTCTVTGVEAQPVSVEVFMRNGQLPGMLMVGLPDAAVRESKERVFAAIATSGYSIPLERITVNLAPANLRKEGSAFDLPIAVGLLQAMGIVKSQDLHDTIIVGELSLDGALHSVRGVLPMATGAGVNGWKRMIVPVSNAREAAVVNDLDVFGASTLQDVVNLLNNGQSAKPVEPTKLNSSGDQNRGHLDMSDIKGQEHAKRALEVAVAGGHNMLMIGPPGSGKTMLARRITSILPDMTLREALEITKIHSICGYLEKDAGLVTTRPFRAPHHSISDAGLIGGGSYPMPGEVSLAHHGVLFLDELPEFKRHVLEVLRQPLEDGQVTISRAQISLTYPGRSILVAAMNPCPCGWRTHPDRICRCHPSAIDRYMNRISGPLLDRIDIHVEVNSVKFQELTDKRNGEPSAQIRKRVEAARKIQRERFISKSSTDGNGEDQSEAILKLCNAQMTATEMRTHCVLDEQSLLMMENAMRCLGFSARAFDRILKVSRTIADLDGSDRIQSHHLAEAIQYRALDRGTLGS